ncbi:MAG: N-acetylmuramic acid 6-phosphate etherase [Elusimicrobia bacterium]|nr:N-acetylmuramic acid 6-phosphate etherase [Elusimicrobiota bacterium]MDE2424524.1 N-acetylmuramic acid 6-phosphate etherase [Elusimicrobiota bacterium]
MALKASDYARLATERANPATRHIDRLATRRIVELINAQDALVAPAVGRESGRIARAAELAAEALRRGGRLLFVGAGTSGRIGVLEAAECPPTFGTSPRQVRAAIAGGRASVFRAREGAEDDERAGTAAAAGLSCGDMVVGIAASGITPYVRSALGAARRRGCATVLVTSNPAQARGCADVVIAPRVGAEVLTGSTRLKAGTAAKLVLNALTTAAMIRLHKVYDHWMVDLKPTNRKLRLRAVRLVAELGRVSAPRAARLLGRSGGHVKTAVVMARLGLSRASARRLLSSHEGSLRAALERR